MNAKLNASLTTIAEHYDFLQFTRPLQQEEIKSFAFKGVYHGLHIPPRMGYASVYFCVQGTYRILAITKQKTPASEVRANIARFSDMLRLYLQKYRLRSRELKFNFSREQAQLDLDTEPLMKEYCETIEATLLKLGYIVPVENRGSNGDQILKRLNKLEEILQRLTKIEAQQKELSDWLKARVTTGAQQ